jgi:hypothetical protein
MKEKMLKEFLQKNYAWPEIAKFAQNLTIEEFLKTCERGEWIIWLFTRTNPNCLKQIILATAHSVNTIRDRMRDKASINAVDAAIAFGEGKITEKQLKDFADLAYNADPSATKGGSHEIYASDAAAYAAWLCASASEYSRLNNAYEAISYTCYSAAFSGQLIFKQKQTADICRKYLPLEIWNQNLI